jgi:hypothetical protein
VIRAIPLAALLFVSLVARGLLAAEPEMQPVAVVAISGYQEVLDDIRYLGKLGGDPLMADRLELVLQLFTRKKGLAGLDKSRPWGAAVTGDGEKFHMHAFLPVTDLQELLDSLAFFVGEPEDAGDGMWEIEVQSVPLFVKENNGWAYISRIPESLDVLPEDPLAWLGGLDGEFDLSVRMYPQRVPENLREVGVGYIQQYAEFLAEDAAEGDPNAAARGKMLADVISFLGQGLYQLEHLTLGFAVDQQDKRARLDVGLSALPGSTLAKELARTNQPQTSQFAGIHREDAVLTVGLTGTMNEKQVARGQAMVEAVRKIAQRQITGRLKPADQAEAEAIAAEVFDMVLANERSGRRDMAMALVGDGPYTLIGGSQMVEAARLSSRADQLLHLLDGQPGFSDIRRNVHTHKGITFHSVTCHIPAEATWLPDETPAQATPGKNAAPGKNAPQEGAKAAPARREADEELERFIDQEDTLKDQVNLMLRELRICFGDQAPLIIGVGQDRGYLAFGPDAQQKLIEVIDQSEADARQPVSPLTLSICPWPFIKMAAEADPDNLLMAMYANTPSATSKDRIKLVVLPHDNGATFRIEAEEGTLPLLGILGAMGAAAGGFGGF